MAKLIDTVPIPIKESMEEPSAKVLHTLLHILLYARNLEGSQAVLRLFLGMRHYRYMCNACCCIAGNF